MEGHCSHSDPLVEAGGRRSRPLQDAALALAALIVDCQYDSITIKETCILGADMLVELFSCYCFTT